MKLRAITALNLNGLKRDFRSQKAAEENRHADSLSNLNDLKCMPCYYPINFTSAGISNVRKLFQYGIPDMYSERILIDPKLITKWMNSGIFSGPVKDVLELFDKYSSSFIEQEKEIINLLRARAKIHPDWTMKQILQEVRPVYNRKLRKIQNPVFQELIAEFKVLPKDY
ncbi:hypothetical protein IJ541_09355 [bacterium]|nr:hypothetical protein [bacterium]